MEQELTQQSQEETDSSLWETSSKTYSRYLIDTKDKLRDLEVDLEQSLGMSYDTETNGTFDRFDVSLVGMSIAIDDYPEPTAFYLPFAHDWGPEVPQLDVVETLETLRRFFVSDVFFKICHNAKFDEMVLSRYGIDVRGPGDDTFVMAWLLSEDSSSKGLKALVRKHFGYQMETYEDVVDAAPKKKGVNRDYNFARVGRDQAVSYGGDDAYWCYKLYQKFKPQLEEEGLWKPYEKVDRPFTRTLRKMEARGVTIDQTALGNAGEKIPKLVEQVEGAIYKEAGEVFNIGSGAQLGPILFDKLGIGKNVPRTKKGQYSTDKKTLENYAGSHEIVHNVLRRKKLTSLQSKFIEGLGKFVARDGKIHASFNGCGTVTGRLSSNSPNLQQVIGDEVEEIKIRDFFIPSDGYKFIVADYGQVELRIMAHFAKDQNMIDAFLSGRDFHEETARKMFKLGPEQDVKHRQRFSAKAINFGIGYGRGPYSIAEQVGCSLGEAQEYIASWHRAFPNIGPFKSHVVGNARQYGYIRTISGRKRRLMPEILSDDWGIRGHAERQAFNTKIQGSAADLIKLAMISLEDQLIGYGGHMCIQIHDELVIEVPEEHAENALQTVKHTMENPINGKNPLRLPLVVDPHIVDKWGDAK